jgi:predicted acyl esterase
MNVVTEFPRQIRCVENLWIPMQDGVRLAARMWLPAMPRPIRCLPSSTACRIASATG